MKEALRIKSFGAGILSVEVVLVPSKRELVTESDKPKKDVLSFIQESGVPYLEAVIDIEDESRAFLLQSEGHLPTLYEMSQISDSDWNRLTVSISSKGSSRFFDRYTFLKGLIPRI